MSLTEQKIKFYPVEGGRYNLEIDDLKWEKITYNKAQRLLSQRGYCTPSTPGSCRCARCKVYAECGWSAYRADEGFPKAQLIYEPCEHYCEKAVYTADEADLEGLVLCFEAAAALETKDKGGKYIAHSHKNLSKCYDNGHKAMVKSRF